MPPPPQIYLLPSPFCATGALAFTCPTSKALPLRLACFPGHDGSGSRNISRFGSNFLDQPQNGILQTKG